MLSEKRKCCLCRIKKVKGRLSYTMTECRISKKGHTDKILKRFNDRKSEILKEHTKMSRVSFKIKIFVFSLTLYGI